MEEELGGSVAVRGGARVAVPTVAVSAGEQLFEVIEAVAQGGSRGGPTKKRPTTSRLLAALGSHRFIVKLLPCLVPGNRC